MKSPIPILLVAVVFSSCTRYTHDKPDTRENRAGFEKHIGFEAPASVSNLYYYADELGADVTYQLGFYTDEKIIEKIISQLSLNQDPPDTEVGVDREFPSRFRNTRKVEAKARHHI